MNQKDALTTLAALAQETRLDAFRLLVKAGPQGLAAGTIAAELGARQNTLSAHLNVLTRAGLIHRGRKGRTIRYRADYDRMRALLLYLLEDCCRGDAAICAPLVDALAC